MCGRFTLKTNFRVLATTFDLPGLADLVPRYNVAPSQSVAIVRVDSVSGQRTLDFMRWGLVPAWSEDPAIGNQLINARGESVADKPSFREAFLRRRCLVLADGFFEWHKQGRHKQPFYVHRPDGVPFAFAGLWEHADRCRPPLDTCTIITTASQGSFQKIHERVPVILAEQDYQRWLDPQSTEPADLLPLLRAFGDDEMVATPVGALVNSPANDDPRCVDPLVPIQQRELF